MDVRHVASCDGPNCDVTADARSIVSPLGMKTGEWGAPDEWVCIILERARQGVSSNPPGGYGRMAFHSARCLANWAAKCAGLDIAEMGSGR